MIPLQQPLIAPTTPALVGRSVTIRSRRDPAPDGMYNSDRFLDCLTVTLVYTNAQAQLNHFCSCWNCSEAIAIAVHVAPSATVPVSVRIRSQDTLHVDKLCIGR